MVLGVCLIKSSERSAGSVCVFNCCRAEPLTLTTNAQPQDFELQAQAQARRTQLLWNMKVAANEQMTFGAKANLQLRFAEASTW